MCPKTITVDFPNSPYSVIFGFIRLDITCFANNEFRSVLNKPKSDFFTLKVWQENDYDIYYNIPLYHQKSQWKCRKVSYNLYFYFQLI